MYKYKDKLDDNEVPRLFEMAAKNKHIFSTPMAIIVFRRKMDKLSGKQIVRSGGGMAARRLLN